MYVSFLYTKKSNMVSNDMAPSDKIIFIAHVKK